MLTIKESNYRDINISPSIPKRAKHIRGVSLQVNPLQELGTLKKKEQLAKELNYIPENSKLHHRHLPMRVEIMQYLEELDKEDQEFYNERLTTEPIEMPEYYIEESKDLKERDIERQKQNPIYYWKNSNVALTQFM